MMSARTALQLLGSVTGVVTDAGGQHSPRFLSFGCPDIDRMIGGIPAQGITEIAGEAGCGKTQICLSLSLQAQLPLTNGGLDGSVAYMSCGEGQFPIRRLSQLAVYFESLTGISQQSLLSKVHIEHLHNSEDVLDVLRRRVPELCHREGIKLLVVDSLAGLLRFDFDSSSTEDMKQRTMLLFQIAQQLKLISDLFGTAIVVLNQVKASLEVLARPMVADSGERCGTDSIPALGLAWSHCINTRIHILRDTEHIRTTNCSEDATVRNSADSYADAEKENLHELNTVNSWRENLQYISKRRQDLHFLKNNLSSASRRTMVLEFSPILPARKCKFAIEQSGIFGNGKVCNEKEPRVAKKWTEQ